MTREKGLFRNTLKKTVCRDFYLVPSLSKKITIELCLIYQSFPEVDTIERGNCGDNPLSLFPPPKALAILLQVESNQQQATIFACCQLDSTNPDSFVHFNPLGKSSD